MAEFGRELDLYEREMTARVGASAAHEARAEMGAHLLADYEARVGMGVSPEAARLQALAAVGDLGEAARGEVVPVLPPPTRASSLVPFAIVIAFLVVSPYSDLFRPLIFLASGLLLVAAAFRVRGERGLRWGAGQVLTVLLPAAAALAVYRSHFPPAAAGFVLSSSVVAVAGVVVILAAGAGRARWGVGLLSGTLAFLGQTLGVELSLRSGGHRAGYPLDVTVGTWLAFTVAILVLLETGAMGRRVYEGGRRLLRRAR